MQCSQRLDHCCLQATVACIGLITLFCGLLRRFAKFTQWKWRNALFRNIDNCFLCLPYCCCARCWKLQDRDLMEASCIFYIKVGRFDQLEHNKISVVTVTALGIVILTVNHDFMVSVWFVWYPGDVLRQTSPNVLSVESSPLYIYQTWDFSCYSSHYIPVNTQST